MAVLFDPCVDSRAFEHFAQVANEPTVALQKVLPKTVNHKEKSDASDNSHDVASMRYCTLVNVGDTRLELVTSAV